MTADETIQRARLAREVLENPLVVEALAAMRAKLLQDWRSSMLGQSAEREALYYLNCAIDEFEAQFTAMISDGNFAEAAARRDQAGKP